MTYSKCKKIYGKEEPGLYCIRCVIELCTNLSLSPPILKESLHLVEAVGLLLEVLEEAEQLLRHSQAGIIALSLAILLRRLSSVKRFGKLFILYTLKQKSNTFVSSV